jgi:hypothetical protein
MFGYLDIMGALLVLSLFGFRAVGFKVLEAGSGSKATGVIE